MSALDFTSRRFVSTSLLISHSNQVQSTKDAVKFYEAKVNELGNNLKDLEAIIGQKSNNLRVVEDGMSHSYLGEENYADFIPTVLRQKVLTSGAGPSAQAA